MIKFRNVHVETRNGREVYYYRENKGRRIRLPAPHETADFAQAVRLAATLKVGRVPPPPDNARARTRNKIGRCIRSGLLRAKQRAKAKGLPFELNEDWVIEKVEAQGLRCAITGIPFYFGAAATMRDPYAPSLDRIDSSKGYTGDNVRVVLYALNVMLSDWGAEIFEKVAMGYRAQQNKKCKPIPAPRGLPARTLEKE